MNKKVSGFCFDQVHSQMLDRTTRDVFWSPGSSDWSWSAFLTADRAHACVFHFVSEHATQKCWTMGNMRVWELL